MFRTSTQHTSTRLRTTGRLATGLLAVALAGYTLPPAAAADSAPPPTPTHVVATVATVAAAAAPAAVAPVRTRTTTIYFATSSARVTAASRTTLSRFVRAIPASAAVLGVQVRGYVQGSPTTRNNRTLSHARAANTAVVLKSLTLRGPYSLTAGGVAGNTLRARRAVVTVTYRLRVAQTITFAQPAGMAVGAADQSLTATSTSRLAVAVASLTPSVCTVVARKLHAVAAGSCRLRATQAGNTFVLAAAPVLRTVAISPAPPTRFTVTYDAGSGAADPSSAVFTVGGSGLTLPTPTYANHVFGGWFTAAIGGTSVTSPYSPTGDTTVYAHWTALQSVVTYDLNYTGASAPTTDSYTYPTALSLPSAARAHYVFAGWYDDPTNGTRVGGASDSYSPDADTTLYAHWTAEQFVVTYDANYTGAPAATTATFTYPNAVTLPLPVRAHYVFTGWFDDATAGNSVGMDGATFSPVAATRLYAHWTAESFVVTYDLNYVGSPAATTDTFTYPGALSLPLPVRNEWSFLGWYDAASGGNFKGGAGTAYSPSATTTLYAHWTEFAATAYDVTITNNSAVSVVVDYCATAPAPCSGINVGHTTLTAGSATDIHVYTNTTNVTGSGELSGDEIAITLDPNAVDFPALTGGVVAGQVLDHPDLTQTLTFTVAANGSITLSTPIG